jgi:integrase
MAKVIPYDEVKEIIEQETGWLQAALAIQYAAGSRVGEMIQYENRSKTKTTKGVLRKSFDIREDGIDWVHPNFKAKKKPDKKPFVRKKEKWLYEIIKKWLEVCAEQVIPLRISWVSENINRVLHQKGYTSHDLRHSRATHLVEIYDYNVFEIQEALGHSKIETSAIYVHSSKMKKKIDAQFPGLIIPDEFDSTNLLE